MALLGPNIPNTTAIIAGSIIAIDAVVMVYIANTKMQKNNKKPDDKILEVLITFRQ